MALLDGKKLLITGVLTDRSIAYTVARRAQEEGAEIVLTGFGRALRLTQRMAQRLPQPPDVLEMDVTDEAQIAAVAAELQERWGVVDGVLHAIAFVPGDALGGRFLEAPVASAVSAFEISAFSLKSLGAAVAPGNDKVALMLGLAVEEDRPHLDGRPEALVEGLRVPGVVAVVRQHLVDLRQRDRTGGIAYLESSDFQGLHGVTVLLELNPVPGNVAIAVSDHGAATVQIRDYRIGRHG